MQRQPSGAQQGENAEKRRRAQSKFNKDLPRYECFCSKQYLSYPALYLHMKNKHYDYFENNKNGKKVEPTKLIESYNHNEGYKVYKIAVDLNNFQNRRQQNYQYNPLISTNNTNNFAFNQNLLSESNPQLNRFYIQLNKLGERPATIQLATSAFLKSLTQKTVKYKTQVQLFLILLIDCINKNYQKLLDKRIQQKKIKRYTAEFDCQYIMNILPYFQDQYLNTIGQDQSKPFSFFVKNSHIITSGLFKSTLHKLYNFMYIKNHESKVQFTQNNNQSSEMGGNEDEGYVDESLEQERQAT